MKKSLEKEIRKLVFIFITLPVIFVGVILIYHYMLGNDIIILSFLYSFVILFIYLIFIRILRWFFNNLYDSDKMMKNTDLRDTINLDSSIERYQKLYKAFKFSEQVEKQIDEDCKSLASELIELKTQIEYFQKKQIEKRNEYEFEKSSNEIFMNTIAQPIIHYNSEGLVNFANQSFVKQFKYSKIDSNNVNSIFKDIKGDIKALDLLKGSVDAYINLISENQNLELDFEIGTSFKTIQLSNDQYLSIGKSVNDEVAMQSRILRKNREIEYINQINSSLISNWDIDELLDNIMKRMDSLFNLSFGCIHIRIDEHSWELKTCKAHKFNLSQISELTIPKYFSEDWINSITIKTIDVKFSHYEDLSYIVLAPLEVDGKIIAAMSIGLDRELSNNDENLLRMFNHQASMVVQRALLYDQLRKQYLNTIQALVNVIEAKDKYTEGHSRRVSRFAVEIAKKMGYSNEEIENIEISGLLHDVGKIGIQQSILVKEGKLTDIEYEEMKQHPVKGIQVLEAIKLNSNIQDGILYHHLRYDLLGYPKSDIKELPVYAAIIGIADAFDAITSARSYSKAESIEDALNELERFKGKQFAPEMVDIFKRLVEENYDRIHSIIEDVSDH